MQRMDAFLWKVSLLSRGIVLDPVAIKAMDDDGFKTPFSVRSGTSGGLELSIDGGVAVNAPFVTSAGSRSPIRLRYLGDGAVKLHDANRKAHIKGLLRRRPEYYGRTTRSGKPMALIGQMCFDRIGFGLQRCVLGDSKELACGFCAYNSNWSKEIDEKTNEDVIEVAVSSATDPACRVRHVLLTGGTTSDKRYLETYLEIAQSIRSKTNLPVSVMMAPPKNLALFDRLESAGVSDIAINLEVYDSAQARAIIPGKFFKIGSRAYYEALSYAVSVFGKGNVRSLLIAGLEPPNSTLEGVDFLSSMGVIPVLSPFRPMAGTRLEGHNPPSESYLSILYEKAKIIARQNGMFLGPKCIDCQNNTITMPWDSPDYDDCAPCFKCETSVEEGKRHAQSA